MMRARLIAAVCGVLLWAASPAQAEAPQDQRSAAAALRGQEFYEIACADCHGFGGKGDGPMAQFLTVKPSDLTALASRDGGLFPFRSVFETLDGRATVPQHGRPGMPIWGWRVLGLRARTLRAGRNRELCARAAHRARALSRDDPGA